MNDNFKGRGNKSFLITVIIICSLCLVSIFIWSKEGSTGPLHSAQQDATKILSPLSSLTKSATKASSESQKQSSDENASSETLSQLKEQNAELTSQVAKGEEYRQEAQRLQELLNLKDSYDIDGVSAHVIGKTSENWNQSITIDIGEADGSFVGATVCSSFGVIGQVSSVTSSTSVVRLLTDPQSGVAGMIQSSRATCVVKGSLDGLLTAEDIGVSTEVKEGDIIITSGLGGSFTRGIIIGTVSKVSGNSQDGSLKATIKQADNTNFEEVIVVKSASATE